MVDARTPVVVGVGQLTQQPVDLADALEPVEMMAEVAHRAATDTGAPALLSRVALVAVVKGAWSYRDPGRIVADAIWNASLSWVTGSRRSLSKRRSTQRLSSVIA